MIGYSATLFRPNRGAVHPAFNHLAYHISLTDIIKQGWVCDIMLRIEDIPCVYKGASTWTL